MNVGSIVFAPLPKAGEPRAVDMAEEFKRRVLEWRPISQDDLPFPYPATLVLPKPRIRVKAGSRKLP